MKYLINAISCLFILSACSSDGTEYHIVDSNLPAQVPPNYGFLIGSFSHDESGAGLFDFRNLADHHVHSSIEAFNLTHTEVVEHPGNDVNADNDKQFVFILPQGNYEFYNFDAYMKVGGVTKKFYPKENFSIPFSIQQGQSTYIGNLNETNFAGKNLFGSTVPGGSNFTFSDKSSEDLPLLKVKYPFLNNSKVIIAVPKSGIVPPELVQFK